MALASGARVGVYVVRRLLGAGGMGEVYLATDTRLDRDVAIKILPPEVKGDPARLARLQQEAHAVAALEHPHICRLYDVGPDYLVMEYVDGQPLKGPLPLSKAVEYGLQILDALGAAHRKGVVHRDLKPANLLETARGVTLLDFGVATAPEPAPAATDDLETRDALTRDGMLVGTPAYMAPEQLSGRRADVRSDLYAFGAVLYEMLTGRRVGPARDPLPQPRLESVIKKCLAANPDERYQSAADVSAALAGATAVTRGRVVRRASAAAAILVVVIGGLLLWQRRTPAAPLTAQDVLVVADVDNQTGDPLFDIALRQALTFQLQESPFLRAMDNVELRGALAGSGRPPGARITGELARELCVREGHKATLQSSIVSVGSTYMLGLQAVNCATGETIAREQVIAKDKNQVVDALARATSAMRAKLGESLTSVSGDDRLYSHRVTTSSLEALQAFYLGDDVWTRTGNSDGTIPHYERATELDPNFALAWAVLGLRYGSRGEPDRYRESVMKAYGLRDKASERERLVIESAYYGLLNDIDKVIATQELLTRLYPRDPMLHFNLGNTYLRQNQLEKAVAEAEAAMRLGPRMIQGYIMGANALMDLNRIDESRAVLRKALSAGFDIPAVHSSLLYIAQGLGDRAAADAEIRWLEEKTPNEPLLARQRANDAAALGQIATAERFYRRAQELARAPVTSAAPGRFMMGWYMALATLEMCERVRPARVSLPIADALCGTPQALQEFAAKVIDDSGPIGAARALALMRAGRTPEAAAIFDKMLVRRVSNWGPEYPAALVGRARAAVAAGDTSLARQRYEAFFELWKGADAGLPLMASARKEYAALSRP